MNRVKTARNAKKATDDLQKTEKQGRTERGSARKNEFSPFTSGRICAIISTVRCGNALRGISAVGSAFEWHSKGQGFDSPMLHHLITHVLIQGMGDVFCICEGIKRQITGIICYILPSACKKSNMSRHLAGWEPSLSGLSASKPGRDFSKMPAVSAKMHPLWTI